MQNVNAEIIAIGTEILLGEITDTNSVHIARCLRDLGINLYYMTSVGDNEERIANAIHIAFTRADVVITCGGLGPTIDDMTRQGVARATNRGLEFHQPLLDQIAARFATFRTQMTDNNRRQAYLPERAIAIENPVGTAPSFIVEHDSKIVISLPGVPREMKFLLAEKVVPFLRERYRLGIIKAHVLRAAGIGESALDDLIGRDLLEQSNPTVGLAAHQGQIDIRITAKADSVEDADSMIATVEATIRSRAGKFIYGTEQDTLEDAFANLARQVDATVAITEAGIGDAFSGRLKLTEAGESVLRASWTFDDPDQTREKFSLATDTPLQDAAQRTAQVICESSGATLGIAILCYPDVNENADTEQGSAVAIYMPGNTRSRVYGFGGQSESAQAWVSTWALANGWRMLREKSQGG